VQRSRAYLGDSTVKLRQIPRILPCLGVKSVKLLFTSPPYCGVTNYHYDQWIRLWLLGGPTSPVAQSESNRGKFVDRAKYKQLLENVFDAAASSLAKNAVIYVRTDSREVTLDATIDVLASVFPKKKMRRTRRPFLRPTQTDLFGGDSKDGAETDIVLQ
jgi:DNA modification methylase